MLYMILRELLPGPFAQVAGAASAATFGLIPETAAYTVIGWAVRSMAFVLPYYLTLQPGVTMLTFVAGQWLGVGAVMPFVAAEVIFATSGYRARTLDSGLFVGVAMVMVLYFLGDGPANLMWAAIGSAVGGAMAAAIGWFVGLFTRVGR